MKKVALPVENDELGLLFENCSFFKIFTIENKAVSDEKLISAVQYQPGLLPFIFFKDGITDVISNRIQFNTVNKFNHLKINVFVGVDIKNTNSVLNEFIEGNIETHSELCE